MAFQIPAEGRATRERQNTAASNVSCNFFYYYFFSNTQHNTTNKKTHHSFFFLEGFAREVEGDKTTIGEGRSVDRGEARQGKKRVEGVT